MARIMRRASVEVVVEATPQAIWDVVSDPARLGEWSHETSGGVWLDGAAAAVPGARFRALNRSGKNRWTRISEIVLAAEPKELVWRTVPGRVNRDSSEWRIRLEPLDDGGTRVVQSYEVLHLNPVSERLIALLVPAHRDRREALIDDLRRLGVAAGG
jgi:uncharacterized protein YndB with AHSA1/START domain